MSELPQPAATDSEGDAAQAIDALRSEVLTVHVAVAELTKAVEDTRPVDYTVSLGKIAKATGLTSPAALAFRRRD